MKINRTITRPLLAILALLFLSTNVLNAQVQWDNLSLQTVSGTANSLTVNKPIGTMPDHLIIMHLHFKDRPGAITAPTGFTLITSAAGGSAGDDAAVYAYYKIAGASEPASYTFTLTTGAGTDWRIQAVRVLGSHPTNPIGNTNGSYSSAAVTSSTVSLTSADKSALLVTGLTTFNTYGTLTSPSGMTSQYSANANPGYATATQTIATTGATGNKTYSWTTARAAAALLYAINPADIDGDNVADDVDQDDDNDGILDINECTALNQSLTVASVMAIPSTGQRISNLTTTSGAPLTISTSQLHYSSSLFPGISTNLIIFPSSGTVSTSTWLTTSFTVFFEKPVTRFQISGFDFDCCATFEYLEGFSVNPTSYSSNVQLVAGGRYRSNAMNQDINLYWDLATPVSSITFTVGRTSNGLGIQMTLLIDGCLLDTDGDGIYDGEDPDSDNDGCADVIEGGANFVQGASYITNNRLNTTVNTSGMAAVPGGTSGYNTTNGQTVGLSRTATNLVIATPPSDRFVVYNAATSFSIAATSSNATSYTGTAPNTTPVYGTPGNNDANLSYQWYLGDPDNGGTALANGGVYSGVTTATLSISNTNGLSGNRYYVVTTVTNNECIREVRSAFLRAPLHDDFGITNVNVTLTGNLNTNDNAPAGATYGTPVAVVGNPSGCMPTINSNGTYSFNCGVAGEYVFTVPVCAPSATPPCPTTTLSITVLDQTSSTEPPVANADYAITPLNTPVTIVVKANDQCNNGAGCTLGQPTIITGSPNGNLTVNAGGTVTFTPNTGFTGITTFTYEVCDNQSIPQCDQAIVTVTVLSSGISNTTLAVDDYGYTLGTRPVNGNVLTNDIDVEGNAQTVTAQNITNDYGTLVLNSNGTYTFTAKEGISGPVDFVYTKCDNGTPQACDQATLHIMVEPFVLNPDFGVTQVSVPLTGNLKTNDDVPDGSTYGTPVAVTGNPSGCTPAVASSGTYTFTCATPGEYVFVVPVCPPGVSTNCPVDTLYISVLDPMVATNAPTANPDYTTTPKNTPVTIDVRANDRCQNETQMTGCVLSNPTIRGVVSNGTATVNGSGNVVFTPTTGFTGTTTFQYEVCDNQSTPVCDITTVTVTVLPDNYSNTTAAMDDYGWTWGTNPVSGNVLTNDKDPEGHTQTVTAQSVTNTSGTLVLNSNGTYTFTPATGFFGPVDFPYTVCDNGTPQVCDQATLHIMVQNLIPLPVEIRYMNCNRSGNNALINWATATETDSREFIIWRSADGRNWQPLDRVAAAGNSYTTLKYAYTDRKPLPGNNFYRLELVNTDGSREESGVCRVKYDASAVANELFSLYPNPADESLTLTVQPASAAALKVEILSAEGRLIRSLNLAEADGVITTSLNIKDLYSGMYMLRVSGEGYSRTEWFVKR